VRDGPFGSAWFAHHGPDGVVSHVEIRGPDYKGSLKGGTKTLFRFGRAGEGVCRLAVTEAPIDALSLAAIDDCRTDTLDAATGGGIGPGTVSALQGTIRGIAGAPGARLVAATDANRAGDRYAERLSEIAAEAGIPVEHLWRIGATDWNDILQGRAEQCPNVHGFCCRPASSSISSTQTRTRVPGPRTTLQSACRGPTDGRDTRLGTCRFPLPSTRWRY
jgi:hypothetical protein